MKLLCLVLQPERSKEGNDTIGNMTVKMGNDTAHTHDVAHKSTRHILTFCWQIPEQTPIRRALFQGKTLSHLDPGSRD